VLTDKEISTIRRLANVISEAKKELDEIILKNQAPEKPRQRRNLKQEGIEKYRKRYALK